MTGPFHDDIEGDDIMDHELNMDYALQHLADAEEVFDKAVERLALKIFNTILVPFCDKNSLTFDVELDNPYVRRPAQWHFRTFDGAVYRPYKLGFCRTPGAKELISFLNLNIDELRNLGNYMPDYTPEGDNNA